MENPIDRPADQHFLSRAAERPTLNRILKRGLTEEVVYFDELYERSSRLDTGEVEHRYHVGSGERVVATVARKAGAADEVRYLHMDALGSVDVVTDPSGALVEERSYDAFGARRAPVWAAAPPSRSARSRLKPPSSGC